MGNAAFFEIQSVCNAFTVSCMLCSYLNRTTMRPPPYTKTFSTNADTMLAVSLVPFRKFPACSAAAHGSRHKTLSRFFRFGLFLSLSYKYLEHRLLFFLFFFHMKQTFYFVKQVFKQFFFQFFLPFAYHFY